MQRAQGQTFFCLIDSCSTGDGRLGIADHFFQIVGKCVIGGHSAFRPVQKLKPGAEVGERRLAGGLMGGEVFGIERRRLVSERFVIDDRLLK